MVKYTKEAIMFLLMYKAIDLDDDGDIQVNGYKKKNYTGEEYEEYIEIMGKAKMLGKWLSHTSDVKSIYSFFRITP